jgi:sugar phosphate isomerase/epimerase
MLTVELPFSERSYRRQFPFQIGTTSYQVPFKRHNLAANVGILHRQFEKIQLLFFGKAYLDEMMNEGVVDALYRFQAASQIQYSIHLPADFDFLSSDERSVQSSIHTIEKIIERTSALSVQNYVLHIDGVFLRSTLTSKSISKLSNRYRWVTEQLESTFGESTPKFCVENLDFDLLLFSEILLGSKLSVCLDVGHLFVGGFSFPKFVAVFGEKVREIQLHGFAGKKDHMALDVIRAEAFEDVWNFLKTYSESLIVEVFKYSDLLRSMNLLLQKLHEEKNNGSSGFYVDKVDKSRRV